MAEKELNLSENTEDYLEAIYRICRDKGSVRIKDIAESLGIKNPSVTQQVQKLSSMGLVEHESYGKVNLTEKGREIGSRIDRRHRLFHIFLEDILFLPAEMAQEEACRMEHAVSKKTVENLRILSDFLSQDDVYASYFNFVRERGHDVDR